MLQQFFFGTVGQKKSDRNSWHNPLEREVFRYPQIVRHYGVPIRAFSALRPKNFDRKMWYSLLLLFHKIFGQRFLKDRRVLLRTFSVLWDNIFSKQNRSIPRLGIKFFDTGSILKHSRATLRKFLAVWDQKNDKIVVLLLSKKIRHHNISEIQGSL